MARIDIMTRMARLGLKILSRIRTVMGRHGKVVALLTIPLIVNGAIWAGLVVPRQRALENQQSIRAFVELKPRMEAFLQESHQLLVGWEGTRAMGRDASAAMEIIERLAGRHRVEITDLQADRRRREEARPAGKRSKRRESASSTVPLEVSLRGRFYQLAHWMSDLEAQAGLRIESWTLTSAEQTDVDYQLTVQLVALLEKA